MSKKIYFIMGLVVASVGTAGFWALRTAPKPVEPSKQEAKKKVSLLTINYIPTTPTQVVDGGVGAFWELKALSEVEPTEKKLPDLKGKPIILHFWATWCAPCVQELPDLDAFAKANKDLAHIIAIAVGVKDAAKIRDFYKTKGIENLSIVFDKSGVLTRSFQASSLPTTVFINSQGHEIGRIQGAVEWTKTPGRLLKTHLSRN